MKSKTILLAALLSVSCAVYADALPKLRIATEISPRYSMREGDVGACADEKLMPVERPERGQTTRDGRGSQARCT